MYDFLERFQNRMEFCAIIDSIVNRKNKNTAIESMFEQHELDNIIVSVLVFIMESTLTEDRICSLKEINEFISEILPVYKKYFSYEQTEEITRYIIKDILMNKGEKRMYGIMNYELEHIEETPVRLISDSIGENDEIRYTLTDQGYNFLFRTKEIDDELGFKIEEIRLKLLIVKKNYKKAVSQSKELIQMLKNRANQLTQFEHRLNSNIKQVSSGEYTSLINEIYAMLDQEYVDMREIRNMIVLARERLTEEENSGIVPDEKTAAAKREIVILEQNTDTALKLQQCLITQSEKIKEHYKETLKNAIKFMHKKTFDFEKEILMPLEKAHLDDPKLLNSLLAPLMKIRMKKLLNVSLLYDHQKLNEYGDESADIIDDTESGDDELKERQYVSRQYELLVNALFKYAAENSPRFLLSDFIEYLRSNAALRSLVSEKRTYLALLKIYEFGEIDIREWAASGEEVFADPSGEFDLPYCLYAIRAANGGFYGVEKIIVYRKDDILDITEPISQNGAAALSVKINNMEFEVKRVENSSEDI